MFFPVCVAPHFFQPVKFPRFFLHYMYHYIYVIDQYPMQFLVPLMMIRTLSAYFFYFIFDMISNGPYLRLITGFADNKKIRDSFFDFSQVKGYDIFSLFFLDRSNNGFDDFRIPG